MDSAQPNKKYRLEQILNDDADYLEEEALNRIKQDSWKNGDFKHVSLRAIVLLLEKQINGIHRLEEKINHLLVAEKGQNSRRRN